MSDENTPSPTPPVPAPAVPPPSLQKTQSVPLKKETVRITLRAKPGEAPEAPVAPPTAPLRPMAPPPPGGVRPPGPPAPPAPVGSRTIPLTSPQPPRAPGAPAPVAGRPATAPLSGAPATQPMPRPTVRLQPQGAPSAPGSVSPSSAPLKTAVLDADDEEVNEGPLNVLAWVGLATAAVFLLITLFTFDKFDMGIDTAGTSTWKVPPQNVYKATPQGEGQFKSKSPLPDIPEYTGAK